jgi:predicted DsbA family dithiol-disulfide isomerase
MEEAAAKSTSVIVVSDFVCPWCYVGLQAVKRLTREFAVDVRFGPYLLDPTTPPEGKPRRQQTAAGDGPTHLELRAEAEGIRLSRGRTWTSNSRLALEAAEHVAEHHPDLSMMFHEAMFRSYFERLEDIGKLETILSVAEESGVPLEPLREVINDRAYQRDVEDGVKWAREIGVTGVPTVIFDEQYAVVGAQEWPVFDDLMRRIGASPAAAGA